MASLLHWTHLNHCEPDQALEGERCRGCDCYLRAGDYVLLALAPAGYEVAYCSDECLRADREGGGASPIVGGANNCQAEGGAA